MPLPAPAWDGPAPGSAGPPLDAAALRLHQLVQHRDALRASLANAWRSLPRSNLDAVDAWAAAAVDLLEANAGPACLLAFWATAGGGALAGAARGGRSAAQVCRHAGARAALASLNALPAVLAVADPAVADLAVAGATDALQRWLRGLERLARDAPDCVAPAASHVGTLMADRSGRTVEDLVGAGLKAYAADPARRRAFFALEDPWARALLARTPGVPGAAALLPMLAGFSAALWGADAVLRAAQPAGDAAPRMALAGRVVLLPAHMATGTEAAARLLYRAAAAHAGAHLSLPPVRHAPDGLKPVQVALVGLVEDARVEALAMQRYSGLHRLWAPFHTAAPSGARTATTLLTRLARALFDPAHPDPDGFVAKGRALFGQAAAAGLHDPALGLRVGRALGHDLGQMRVQFNARDWVTEPAYRDDNGHLWDRPDQPNAALDLPVQAAARPDPDGDTQDGEGGGSAAGRARPAPPDGRGCVLGTYPEWDAAAGVERPDWATVWDVPAPPGDPAPLLAAMAGQAVLRAQIARLVRTASIGRPVRLRRQPNGDGLDLDAAVAALAALRAGLPSDPRLFTAARPRRRDLATLLLLDTSASTAARLGAAQPGGGGTVLDVQRLAAALLADALRAQDDAFAVCAFASDGRKDVRLTRVKGFGERFDAAALARLAGLRPALSTRLGTVLRHARHELAGQRAWRRLLLVLTDGAPSDTDVADPRDLVADGRRAVLELRAAQVDVFGVVLDPTGAGAAEAVFGRAGTLAMRDLSELPARLTGLYFRLAQR